MYIAEQSAYSLKLKTKKRNYLSFVLLWISFWLFFCLIGTLMFGWMTLLKCQRIEPSRVDCTLVASNFLGLTRKAQKIKQLQSAQVERYIKDDVYRVILNTRDGKIPLTYIHTSGSADKQKTANQINDFLQKSQQRTARIKQNPHLLFYFWLTLASIYTLYFLFQKKTLSCHFDKNADTLCIKRHNIYQSHTQKFPLRKFQKVDVIKTNKRYETVLILKLEPRVSLHKSSSSAEQDEIANAINDWLYLI